MTVPTDHAPVPYPTRLLAAAHATAVCWRRHREELAALLEEHGAALDAEAATTPGQVGHALLDLLLAARETVARVIPGDVELARLQTAAGLYASVLKATSDVALAEGGDPPRYPWQNRADLS